MRFRSWVALNIFKPLLTALARRSAEWRGILRDAIYVSETENLDRVTTDLLALYGKRDSAYSDRGIEPGMERVAAAAIASKTDKVVEIGSCSGALAAAVADAGKMVIGLDFNLDKARDRYGNRPRLSFIDGYPRDTLDEIDGPYTAVSVSTLAHALPRELDLYFDALSKRAERIIISEPMFRYRLPKDANRSRHAKGMCWQHPYESKLKDRGYAIERTDETDGHIFIIAARRY